MRSIDNSTNQAEHGGIRELMLEPEHDLVWLTRALQMAIKLEHATLPPYLCAMWSIQKPEGPVHATIRRIVLDEMFHMGLACNLLTTIGGTPILHDPGFVPRYPGPLPCGVRPDLVVTLAGLSRPQIEGVYMEIEMPEAPIALVEEYPTIGKFYDAIQVAFSKLDPRQITGQRQIKGRSYFAIMNHADASRAIEKIKREGEGTKEFPSDEQGRKAHYYAFKEILVGKQLKQNNQGKWEFIGDPIPFPDVFPMATVPEEGYPHLPASAVFNKLYTAMLKALEEAWKHEGGTIEAALGLMYKLEEPARELIQMVRSPGSNYGPTFRFQPT